MMQKTAMQDLIESGGETLDLPGLEAAARLGQAIAARLEAGDVVALRGDLGAGKTTLARAILAALGHEGEVPSPTFTLVQTYDLPRLSVAHFDLYRLKNPAEIVELGFDDTVTNGAALVEWPEQAEAYLPAERLDVWLESEPRQVRLAGTGRWADLAPAVLREAA